MSALGEKNREMELEDAAVRCSLWLLHTERQRGRTRDRGVRFSSINNSEQGWIMGKICQDHRSATSDGSNTVDVVKVGHERG